MLLCENAYKNIQTGLTRYKFLIDKKTWKQLRWKEAKKNITTIILSYVLLKTYLMSSIQVVPRTCSS